MRPPVPCFRNTSLCRLLFYFLAGPHPRSLTPSSASADALADRHGRRRLLLARGAPPRSLMPSSASAETVKCVGAPPPPPAPLLVAFAPRNSSRLPRGTYAEPHANARG